MMVGVQTSNNMLGGSQACSVLINGHAFMFSPTMADDHFPISSIEGRAKLTKGMITV